MPNYRVNRAQFGPYHRGDVLPAYALAESAGPGGDLTELLERGFVTETDERVTGKATEPIDIKDRLAWAQLYMGGRIKQRLRQTIDFPFDHPASMVVAGGLQRCSRRSLPVRCRRDHLHLIHLTQLVSNNRLISRCKIAP